MVLIIQSPSQQRLYFQKRLRIRVNNIIVVVSRQMTRRMMGGMFIYQRWQKAFGDLESTFIFVVGLVVEMWQWLRNEILDGGKQFISYKGKQTRSFHYKLKQNSLQIKITYFKYLIDLIQFIKYKYKKYFVKLIQGQQQNQYLILHKKLTKQLIIFHLKASKSIKNHIMPNQQTPDNCIQKKCNKEQHPCKDSFMYVTNKSCLSIEQISPKLSFSKEVTIRTYNASFLHSKIVRVNVIVLNGHDKKFRQQLLTQIDDQFTSMKQKSNIQGNDVLFYCNEKKQSRTCIQDLKYQELNNSVVQFLAIRKLFYEQFIGSTFNPQFINGFDAVIFGSYLVYTEKCHLPAGDFIQEAIPKGYSIQRFKNEIKHIFEEINHYKILPSWNKVGKNPNEGKMLGTNSIEINFWNLSNFAYDIDKKRIVVDPSLSQCHPITILQDNSSHSVIFRTSQQLGIEQNQNTLFYTKNSGQRIFLQKQSHNSQKYLIQATEIQYFDFQEQEAEKCKQFIGQVSKTLFEQSSVSNKVNKNAIKSPQSQGNFQSMVLNNEQFKNLLRQKQTNYCSINHKRASKMPLRLQQIILKAKQIAIALTCESYTDFLNSYARLYPTHPPFNPAVGLLSQLTLAQCQVQQDKKQMTSSQRSMNNSIQDQMKYLTSVLVDRYQRQLNFRQHRQLLKHQKVILTTRVAHSCQIDACLQAIELKLTELSLMKNSKQHSKDYQDKSPNKSSFSHSHSLTKNFSFSSQQSRNDQQNEGQTHQSSKVRGQKYQYQNLILWEEISLQRNYNNVQYGASTPNRKQQNGMAKPSFQSSKNHFSLQNMKLQLQNQINHYKEQISKIQSNIANEFKQQLIDQKETSPKQVSDMLVNRTIVSNLLILQFTVKYHFFNSILQRLPPKYNFTQTLYHLEKGLKTIQVALDCIISLLKTNNTNQVQQNKLLQNLVDWQKTFRHNQIIFLHEKLSLLITYLSISDGQTFKLTQILSLKTKLFFGTYHWWNIFVYLLKLKIIESKYHQHLNIYCSFNQSPQEQQTYDQSFGKYNQDLLEIFVKIKQIQLINGQQVMGSFMTRYPRVAKKLISLDKELMKLSTKNNGVEFMLDQRLQKFKQLNFHYPSGLYRYRHHNFYNKNGNLNQLSQLQQNNYRNPQYKSWLSMSSQSIKLSQSNHVVSLYEYDQKFYSQLKHNLSQFIKLLSESEMKSVSFIENRFIKLFQQLKQHPLWKKAEQSLIKLTKTCNTAREDKLPYVDSFVESVIVGFMTVKTIQLMFKCILSQVSTSKIQKLKQSLQSHLSSLNYLIYLKKLINPTTQAHLHYLCSVTRLHLIQLFYYEDLRGTRRELVYCSLKEITWLRRYFKLKFSNKESSGIHYNFFQLLSCINGNNRLCFGGRQMIELLQQKQLYLGLMMNDTLTVAQYYDKKLLTHSMKCSQTFTKIETSSSKIESSVNDSVREVEEQLALRLALADNRISFIEQKIRRLTLNLMALPQQLKSSYKDLVVIAKLFYSSDEYIVSFQYLQLALTLLISKLLTPLSTKDQSSIELLAMDILVQMIGIFLECSFQSQIHVTNEHQVDMKQSLEYHQYWLQMGMNKMRSVSEVLLVVIRKSQTGKQIQNIKLSNQMSETHNIQLVYPCYLVSFIIFAAKFQSIFLSKQSQPNKQPLLTEEKLVQYKQKCKNHNKLTRTLNQMQHTLSKITSQLYAIYSTQRSKIQISNKLIEVLVRCSKVTELLLGEQSKQQIKTQKYLQLQNIQFLLQCYDALENNRQIKTTSNLIQNDDQLLISTLQVVKKDLLIADVQQMIMVIKAMVKSLQQIYYGEIHQDTIKYVQTDIIVQTEADNLNKDLIRVGMIKLILVCQSLDQKYQFQEKQVIQTDQCKNKCIQLIDDSIRKKLHQISTRISCSELSDLLNCFSYHTRIEQLQSSVLDRLVEWIIDITQQIKKQFKITQSNHCESSEKREKHHPLILSDQEKTDGFIFSNLNVNAVGHLLVQLHIGIYLRFEFNQTKQFLGDLVGMTGRVVNSLNSLLKCIQHNRNSHYSRQSDTSDKIQSPQGERQLNRVNNNDMSIRNLSILQAWCINKLLNQVSRETLNLNNPYDQSQLLLILDSFHLVNSQFNHRQELKHQTDNYSNSIPVNLDSLQKKQHLFYLISTLFPPLTSLLTTRKDYLSSLYIKLQSSSIHHQKSQQVSSLKSEHKLNTFLLMFRQMLRFMNSFIPLRNSTLNKSMSTSHSQDNNTSIIISLINTLLDTVIEVVELLTQEILNKFHLIQFTRNMWSHNGERSQILHNKETIRAMIKMILFVWYCKSVRKNITVREQLKAIQYRIEQQKQKPKVQLSKWIDHLLCLLAILSAKSHPYIGQILKITSKTLQEKKSHSSDQSKSHYCTLNKISSILSEELQQFNEQYCLKLIDCHSVHNQKYPIHQLSIQHLIRNFLTHFSKIMHKITKIQSLQIQLSVEQSLFFCQNFTLKLTDIQHNQHSEYCDWSLDDIELVTQEMELIESITNQIQLKYQQTINKINHSAQDNLIQNQPPQNLAQKQSQTSVIFIHTSNLIHGDISDLTNTPNQQQNLVSQYQLPKQLSNQPNVSNTASEYNSTEKTPSVVQLLNSLCSLLQ